jgi:hypothetical protein
MSSLPTLPTIPGLPDWMSFVALLVGLVFVLAFLLMPFSVFGLKSRMEALEARLADMDESLRQLSRQVAATPPLSRASELDDGVGLAPRPLRRMAEPPPRSSTAPVPPPPVVPEGGNDRRVEPRLDWPRRG